MRAAVLIKEMKSIIFASKAQNFNNNLIQTNQCPHSGFLKILRYMMSVIYLDMVDAGGFWLRPLVFLVIVSNFKYSVL